MTRFSMNQRSSCCAHAAANTSARISLVMDTIALVVSIIVVLVSLLIGNPIV